MDTTWVSDDDGQGNPQQLTISKYSILLRNTHEYYCSHTYLQTTCFVTIIHDRYTNEDVHSHARKCSRLYTFNLRPYMYNIYDRSTDEDGHTTNNIETYHFIKKHIRILLYFMHLLTTGTYSLMPVHCRYTDEDVHSHARDINSLQLFLHTVVEIWTKVDDALKEKYGTRLMFHILKACCSKML